MLKSVGGNINQLDVENLRRAQSDGTLEVCGVKLWTALHSDTWRHRQKACEAFYEYIHNDNDLPNRYRNKSKDLFRATLDIAMVACQDKLLQIYFLGHKLLEEAMSPRILGGDVRASEINKAVKPFIALLVEKSGEMTFRAKDTSVNMLMMLFRHPSVEISSGIEAIMDGIDQIGPSKMPWRVITARLEILHSIVKEFGINDKHWNWLTVFNKLIGPSYNNPNPDVKLSAIETTLTFYMIIGTPLRT